MIWKKGVVPREDQTRIDFSMYRRINQKYPNLEKLL